jgi:hypothetical protein
MPSEMTFFIVAAMSKKRRMPEGGTDWTRWEMKFLMGTYRRCHPE